MASESDARGIASSLEESELETASSSPLKLPQRLRRRLMVPRSAITATDIEAKLQQAQLRRQKFHELLRSKARSKPRSSSPLQVEERYKRLEERLNAAEQNRLSILKACSQRRAARRDRANQSLLQRSIKERKYKDCISASISQKRASAQRKRSRLLEEEKAKARAMILHVHDQLEKERPGCLKQQINSHHAVQKDQETEMVAKIVRFWKRFVCLRKTTIDLAKAFEGLELHEESVKSMPFKQLAPKLLARTTIQTTQALVNRLERWSVTLLPTLENIDHLLSKVALKVNTGDSNVGTKKKTLFSRYQVRTLLGAYMILGNPDAIFNGRTECETLLSISASDFVKTFELLLKVVKNDINPPNAKKITFRSQLEAFDKAWSSYLLCFVAWKDNDAKMLEDEMVTTSCQLELSLWQTFKVTSRKNDDSEIGTKAFRKQILESQKILRDKLLKLSGNPGVERLETELSKIRNKITEALESQSSSEEIQVTIEKDSSHLGKNVDNSLSHKTVSSGHSSASTFAVSENELLVNEILHEHNRNFADTLTSGDEDQNILKPKVRETMENAFWDAVMESTNKNDSDFSWILKLVREIRDELCDLSPPAWKQEIIDIIDIEILLPSLRSGNVCMDYFGRILEYALVTLRKLSSPASDDDVATSHGNLLKELAEILQGKDDSKASQAFAINKGLRFVLHEIQNLKKEISIARMRLVEPLIKGNAGIEYLRKAFSGRHGSPSEALISLPITKTWLSTVRAVADQEWHEHTDSLSCVTSNDLSSGVPQTTLRTGGSNLMGTTKITHAEKIGEELSECRGEGIDLLVRLGLLKLVSGVTGLSSEILPETLKLNLTRLRNVQSQLQKLIVMSTSLLILRQILISENMVTNPQSLENIATKCTNNLHHVLDTTKDAGLTEIAETITSFEEDDTNPPFSEKLREKKPIIASLLGKSLQDGDAVFERVSRALYLASRAIVLGGSGVRGRASAEAALRRVGAGPLAGSVVKAVEGLVVVAVVTGNVHGLWYQEILKNVSTD